jgi:monovalent cation:H+ antiporter-2, CPA2 family
MAHDSSSLIAIIVIGLVLAFLIGTLANRLKISPIVGYLLAGVVVGPFTPGFVADQALASQLAEIGVILLMFGVGLHFSFKDLLSVRRIVFPGAAVQVSVSALLGMGVAYWLGWQLGTGIVFGLALSVASTVVLMRAMQERRLVDSERGRIAVGWLVFQDLLMVVVLVMLPPLSELLKGEAGQAASGVNVGALALTLAITLAKVGAFIALMLIVGKRVIPAILHYIAHTGSRELFRLAVLSVALGVAFIAAELFGVSFALGAFVAGMVLSESELSQRAAEESLPLRDAFAVLFFISVGMLFDPVVILREPLPLLATVLVVLIGGAGTAFVMMRLLGHSLGTALLIAAGLGQIGEFSFILADLGIGLEVLPLRARDLVLGTSILTILANPILFIGLEKLRSWLEEHEAAGAVAAVSPEPAEEELRPTTLHDHAVLVGFGRVGGLVGERLRQAGWPLLVIEDAAEAVELLHRLGIEMIQGNAAEDRVLAAANLVQARVLLIAIPNAFEAGQIVKQARAANPGLEIVARAHFDAEVDHLMQFGANTVIMGEREIALAMLAHAQQLPGSAASAG